MADALLYAHLDRLLGAGLASLAVGLLLLALRPATRPFGLMTAAWGLIDALIALASRSSRVAPLPTLVPFVAFNEGLNVAYVAVGATMALLAGERRAIRAFGLAVVVQGAILLALDGWLWKELTSLP